MLNVAGHQVAVALAHRMLSAPLAAKAGNHLIVVTAWFNSRMLVLMADLPVVMIVASHVLMMRQEISYAELCSQAVPVILMVWMKFVI
jgi:hypothetical protein